MRRTASLVATAIIVACFAPIATAEDRPAAQLTGRVTDTKTGTPVENAEVSVSDGAGRSRTVTTDRRGRYALDVAPGAYDVTVRLGTSRARGHVSIAPHQSVVLDAQVATHQTQSLTGHVTDTATTLPVENAQVRVIDAAGHARAAITDSGGSYTLDVAPGVYDVVVEYGESISRAQVSIEPGQSLVLNTTVRSLAGEVIEIHDPMAPKVKPKPTNHSPIKAPPYSDEALAKDAWTRAWMLLDVGVDGSVRRFKFLKRPGYDLEKIAAAEVFKLKFEPARNHDDKPVATSIVWGIEWPSNAWLQTMIGARTRLPSVRGFPPRGEADYVPCKGSGPMNLGSIVPTYRDCSQPEPSRAQDEPWIVKP